MQPHLFPYIGYFQLMRAVDKFVVLDDVTYIKGGWINRNRILANRKVLLFTVPIAAASSNKLIQDLEIAEHRNWRDKLLKTIVLAYKKAPCYETVYPLLEGIVRYPGRLLADYIVNSLTHLHRHLGLMAELVTTSLQYRNHNLKGQERFLDICHRENAREYINAPGGAALYSATDFSEAGITLRFLQPRTIRYRQFDDGFVAGLSIINVLMFNPLEQVRGGEEPGQPTAAENRLVAEGEQLTYSHIPVIAGQTSVDQVRTFQEALSQAGGPY